MTTETATAPTILTAEAFAALQVSIRADLAVIPSRPCPPEVDPNDLPAWVEWMTTTEEPLSELAERYKVFPTAQHLSAATIVGALGASVDVSRLMNMWADFYEDCPEALQGHGLSRVKTILEQRRWAARSLPLGLPPIEVCRTLWALDPESPTGLRSVRTGKALKGEPRAKGSVIVYRPATGEKFSFDPDDIVFALEEDLDGSELTTFERAELARIEQLKEDRESVTTITEAELQAINEEFPAAARLAFIDMRLRYNNRRCEFRTWDHEAKRVTFDAPAVLADMRSYVGVRTVERFERLVEQGIDLAGILCAHLRIPLIKGSLMFQDPDNTAKGRI